MQTALLLDKNSIFAGIMVVTLELYIKNMVCNRCIKVVREELEKLGLQVQNIELGKVIVTADENQLPDLKEIKRVLEENGFELLEDKKVQTVERIKTLIIELIQDDKLEMLHENLSGFISRSIGRDYHYLSSLFSSIENITIEKFIILQKVERIKELLVYDEQTVSEIAYRLGYSSSAHLSNQFKQVTGFTPTQFKQLKAHSRKPLDEV